MWDPNSLSQLLRSTPPRRTHGSIANSAMATTAGADRRRVCHRALGQTRAAAGRRRRVKVLPTRSVTPLVSHEGARVNGELELESALTSGSEAAASLEVGHGQIRHGPWTPSRAAARHRWALYGANRGRGRCHGWRGGACGRWRQRGVGLRRSARATKGTAAALNADGGGKRRRLRDLFSFLGTAAWVLMAPTELKIVFQFKGGDQLLYQLSIMLVY
ncbi:hypothetical protein C2845_PM13G19690 [Panicum miliaceum]|uniref:Uncharacterized protein n=1 Tax=Panicum miliaceum TaxID=4540 RepID=A0A3L6RHB6_PANMI|nr:hypothetical protein C2845_PM13G19690 [Panicum miliaceum]